MASATTTGAHAPLSSRGTPSRPSPLPSPPPPDEPAFAEWIHKHHRHSVETRELAEGAIEASLRVERVIGVEPQPAQGIEGTGLLKVLASHVRDRAVDERRRSDMRLIVGAITATVLFLGALLGVLKTIGVIR